MSSGQRSRGLRPRRIHPEDSEIRQRARRILNDTISYNNARPGGRQDAEYMKLLDAVKPCMRTILTVVLAIGATMPARAAAQTGPSPTLDVYVIDVEGGNSVLLVSPSHEVAADRYGNAGAVAAPEMQ